MLIFIDKEYIVWIVIFVGKNLSCDHFYCKIKTKTKQGIPKFTYQASV